VIRRLPLAAVVTAAALLTGCASGSATPSTPMPSPSPTESATPVTALAAGECYDPSGQGLVVVVECDVRHAFEVFASLLVEAEEYPGEAVSATAGERCTRAFEAFVGLEYDASELLLRTIAPSAATWAQGDREILCVISDPIGPVAGSLEGALR